jgi:hypothetical protein
LGEAKRRREILGTTHTFEMPHPSLDISRLKNVPKENNPALRRFCQGISTDPLLYIEYTDVNYGYKATHCYDNVRHYVKNHGGEAVYGWIIWKGTDYPLEAEHHAVWKSPSGKIFDITPRVDGENIILFLIDNSRPYDFKNTWCNRSPNGPVYRGIRMDVETIPYAGGHPYHDWIENLPGKPENGLE